MFAAVPSPPPAPPGAAAAPADRVVTAPARRDWAAFETEVARRTFRVGVHLSAAGALVFALLYGLVGPREFVLPNLAGAVLLVLSGLPRRSLPGPQIAAALTIGLLMFGWQLFLAGHIDNGITVWFVVPCVAAMILGAHRLAVYCLSASLSIVLGVVAGSRLGWLHGGVRLPDGDLTMLASIIGVLTLCGSFAVVAFRARQRLVREIELRNAELGAALEDARLARNAAVEAARAKERFFANVTHEIRTPLSGIVGSAELLQRTTLSGEQRPLAQALSASTRQLLELVNAMLDHAKLAAGHVGIERVPVDLRQWLASLEGLYRAQATDKGLTLTLVLDPDAQAWVETDALKLGQIAGNLVANAIKFTPRGSVSVRLGCTADRPGGDTLRLRLRVSDTGIGIPAELQPQIFEPFVQGEASIARSYGGTGLGLAIARQLAELMRGSLTVDSRPGEGARFELSIPVHRASAPPPAPPAPEQALPAGLRVLLVEDNPINLLIAMSMLQALGVAPDTAADGTAAVLAAEERAYDVVLMDLQMPGLDGIEATRRIRAAEALTGRPPTPIVALTGNSPDDYGEACQAAGMNGYLMKPVRLEALRAVLAGHAPRR